MLPENFKEPAGFQWGDFSNLKNAKIRYGFLQPEGEVKGTMVISTGFREPIEKYFEVIREMTAKGFAVWVMDWRGQGGSDRYLKGQPQKMYSEGYDEQIATLHQFVDEVVKKSPGPLILTAHSMGAHIGLRYLKEHDGVFDSAVLSAPMFDVNTGTFPKQVARQMARFAKAGNYLEKYRPGGGEWNEKEDKFEGNGRTSDRERFDAGVELYRIKPELRTGDPTYGWVYHTFKSIDILKDEKYLKAIKTPILIEISGSDPIVDSAASDRACNFLPNCTRVDIKEAKHEIWMERDDLRNQWLKKVGDFLEERLKKHAPAPKKPSKNTPPPPKMG